LGEKMYKFMKAIIVSNFSLIWWYYCAHRKYFIITGLILQNVYIQGDHIFTLLMARAVL